MMEENKVLECLKTRRSIKKYNPDKMPSDEILNWILEAGTFAPCGRGMQSAIMIAITDKATRDRLSVLNAEILGTESDPFYGAPAVVAVLASKECRTYLYDGTLVMGNLMNAAHSLGVASCWIHRAKEIFESEEGLQMLEKWGIRGNYEGIGFCILGYPANLTPKEPKPRKSDYIHYVR